MSDSAIAAEAGQGHVTGYGTRNYRAYVLGALLLVYILNFIDRSLMGVVSEEIKNDFNLSDWDVGLLNGPPFAIFYAVMGLPIAMWADRSNRVWIMTICIVLWSIMTALCGLAAGFLMLLLFRVGVAIGEAGCTPPANSIIADYFPAQSRAGALGVYSTGVTIGTFLAFYFGGQIAGINGPEFGAWLNGTGLGGLFSGVDWENTKGWRIAFVIVGLPGVLIGLLLWSTVKEPPRGFTDPPGTQKVEKSGFSETIKELAGKPSFWWAAIAAAFVAFVGYALFAFQNSYLQRVHGLGVGEASLQYGAPWSLIAAAGTFAGGFLIERFSRKSANWIALIPAIGLALSIPFYLIAIYSENTTVVFWLWSGAAFLHYMYLSSQFMIGQSVVGAKSRATAIAILLILVSLIGNGLGPTFSGAISTIFANSNLAAAGITAEQAATVSASLCKGTALVGVTELEAAFCEASREGLKGSMAATVMFLLVAVFAYVMCTRTFRRDIVAEVEA